MLPELHEINSHDSSIMLLAHMAIVYNPNEVPNECWVELVVEGRV
jgi:hypothetical protein